MWDNINIALLIFGFIALAFAWKFDKESSDYFFVALIIGIFLWGIAFISAVVQWVFGWWG